VNGLVTSADIAAWVGAFMWPLFRILGMFSIAPVLGTAIVPVRVRVVLALAVTVVVVPALPAPELAPLDVPRSVLIAINQVLIGMAMGFVLRMVFAALELGAQVIALQMGLGFAELIDPQGGAQVPTLAQFYVMIGTLVFLAMNGHHLVLQLLFDSFRTLPIGAPWLGADALWALIAWAGEMFRGAVLVALSATVALVSVNVLMGVITRAVPQFNMFVAFPAILLLGFLIVTSSITTLDTQIEQLLDSAVSMVRTELIRGS
jgi:flagellar biosynthesis protein FliR